jgi:hypothetical protein
MVAISRYDRPSRQKRQGVSTASAQARQVLQALGITETKPPVPAEGPRELM